MDKIPGWKQEKVGIASGSINLECDLTIPNEASGIVLFAHGSGSSRNSPRNRLVAELLNRAGFATLLFDLLSPEEERRDNQTSELRFNIAFLAERLIAATEWLAQNLDIYQLKIGYFGASTGAGAALVAAAELPQAIGAVVSRGGRPDLAGSSLPNVQAPTLLIVGGNDTPVIEMNQTALAQLGGEKKLEIVPQATHLFEEPGALEEVARLASDWFCQYLAPSKQPSPVSV